MNNTRHVCHDISSFVLASQLQFCTSPHSDKYDRPSLLLLLLPERARCHADSGTQQCQRLAAAPPNTITVRCRCQPKRSSGIPVHFIIFLPSWNLAVCSQTEMMMGGSDVPPSRRHSVRCFWRPNHPRALRVFVLKDNITPQHSYHICYKMWSHTYWE